MMADCMSEPLTGTPFKFMRAWILNSPEQQICRKMVMTQNKKVKTKRFDRQCRSVLNNKTNGEMTDAELIDLGSVLKRVCTFKSWQVLQCTEGSSNNGRE